MSPYLNAWVYVGVTGVTSFCLVPFGRRMIRNPNKSEFEDWNLGLPLVAGAFGFAAYGVRDTIHKMAIEGNAIRRDYLAVRCESMLGLIICVFLASWILVKMHRKVCPDGKFPTVMKRAFMIFTDVMASLILAAVIIYVKMT